MKQFDQKFKRRRGSASLWTFFIATILISFSVLVYSGMTIQSKYQQAVNEIERAANIALDANLVNPMVRDIQLAVPIQEVNYHFEANLQKAGYSFVGEGNWIRQVDGRTVYSLSNYSLDQGGDRYVLTATLKIPLPWGSLSAVSLPAQTTVQVLFLDFS